MEAEKLWWNASVSTSANDVANWMAEKVGSKKAFVSGGCCCRDRAALREGFYHMNDNGNDAINTATWPRT